MENTENTENEFTNTIFIAFGTRAKVKEYDEDKNSFITIRPNQFKEHQVNIPNMLNGIDKHTIDSVLNNRKNVFTK